MSLCVCQNMVTYDWAHIVVVCVFIFLKESATRAGMCLISCGQPAVSLQDPSELSASFCLPRAKLLSLGDGSLVGRGRKKELLRTCVIIRQHVYDDGE